MKKYIILFLIMSVVAGFGVFAGYVMREPTPEICLNVCTDMFEKMGC